MALGLLLLFVAAHPSHAQPLPDSVMIAHFVDVGQASAVLLEFSCGALMIDAGAQDDDDVERLLGYVENFFADRPHLENTLHTLFVTHNHVDHTRALADVADAVNVRTVIEHGKRGGSGDIGDRDVLQIIRDRPNGVNVIDVDQSEVVGGLSNAEIDPLDCAGTDPAVQILWADLEQNPGWPADEFRDKNNHSLVIRLDFGESSFLFTGDLEQPGIEELLHAYEDTDALDVDVYHVGHHGSANATTWDFLEAMDWLEIAVISMGPCNRNVGLFNAYRFGHPRDAIVDMLRTPVTRRRSTPKSVPTAHGVSNFTRRTVRDAIYATGWDGTVKIRATSGGKYRVTVENQDAPAECG